MVAGVMASTIPVADWWLKHEVAVEEMRSTGNVSPVFCEVWDQLAAGFWGAAFILSVPLGSGAHVLFMLDALAVPSL